MSAEQPILHNPKLLVPGQEGFNASLERAPITIDSLLADNHSQKADRRRRRFEEDEQNGSQVVIFRCSDSRYILTYRKGITISSIAACGPKKQFKDICDNECVPGIIVLPHENCGGLGAKSILEEFGFPEDPNEMDIYAQDQIPDSDPVVMAARTAVNVSKIVADKPVLAAIHKHNNGDIIPLAVYRNGKPSFQTGTPEVFAEFFKFQQNYVAHIKSGYPNLEEIQATQNPELMVITRNRRPLEVGFPETTRRPGSVFRILSSRPEDGNIGNIDSEDAALVTAQAYYPINHFSGLKSILIETKTMDASINMTIQLLRKPWAKIWATKKDSEIYVAQTIHGEIEDIKKYPL